MKKITQIVVASLIAIIMAFSLAACGGKPSGKYVAEEFTVKTGGVDITVKVDELEDSDEIDAMTKMMLGMLKAMTLEFSGDEVTIKMGELVSETGKFKMDGNKIIPLDDEGNEDEDTETGTMTFKGGKIYMEMNEDGTEVKAVFKKA